MIGEKALYITRVTLGVMAFLAFASLGVVQQFIPWLSHVGFNGWFIWLLLILLLIGPYHPPALDDVTELDRRRRMVGWLVLAIFIITFVPVPMRVIM
jgi:hypothetical protein